MIAEPAGLTHFKLWPVSNNDEGKSDEVLAREAQAGDESAFEELVRRHELRIYQFAVRRCGNDTDAREITQDSFVRAYQALAQFHPDRCFVAWLFAIARRKCIDCLRRRDPEGERLPEPSTHDDPAEALSREEDSEALWTLARATLNHTEFEALWLRYVEDFRVVQLAEALQKTETHVKVLLFRARLKLGEVLRQNKVVSAEVNRQRSSAGRAAIQQLVPAFTKIENQPQNPL